MMTPILLISLALAANGAAECRVTPQIIADLRDERITGSLEVAESEARRILRCPDLEGDEHLALRLELAKTLDRVGLHTDTRPVAEALEILRRAETEADPEDPSAQAKIALALAEYFYRAEMGDRQFPTATTYARKAEALFREQGDPVGETEAVHRLGLIELQRGNSLHARELFDRSLELSKHGPRRPIFLSDYHRHVGFVDLQSGDHVSAIEHFEKSLAYRNEAGSRDYGLFARSMLGSALIDGGRPAEARPYLEQAIEIAREIPSPVGGLRATYNLGKMYEALGETDAALGHYRQAYETATQLEVASIQKAAHEGVTRLQVMESPE